MKPAITRFAPSPTGYVHIGNLRTALFAWLWARHTGGQFLLRIEDTDRARFIPDAEDQIKRSLEWLGLDWDGAVLHQSERQEIYRKYAQQLIDSGHAYVASETADELTAIRQQQQAASGERPLPNYNGASRERGLAWEQNGTNVIRFKWPAQSPSVQFDDLVRGETITVDPALAPSAFEDFVLIKSDGLPTYNFAHVVDDHLQDVNIVLRGDEFVASAHKYAALYAALDWPQPAFGFVPPILGPAGTKKLSKRDGATEVFIYQQRGILPEALVNFLVLIGWSPGGDRELFFDRQELVAAFELGGLQKSPGRFDETKLLWANGEHLRQLDAGQLPTVAATAGFWKPSDRPAYDAQVLALAVERAQTLAELADVRDSFYYRRPKLTAAQIAGEVPAEEVGQWLERVYRALDDTEDWNTERLQEVLHAVREELTLKPKQLYPVIREALTGAPQTPALWELLALFGKDESLARLAAAQDLLR